MADAPQTPALSIIVAAHDRPLRLRWLLNALEGQTLDRREWEVVVCHGLAPADAAFLDTHPLARDGTLRAIPRPAGAPSTPGAYRNAALAIARAPVLVFTDDDCRPPPGWLAAVRAGATQAPEAIVQGEVHPDPDESVLLRAPYPRSQTIVRVPTPWGQCANIACPRGAVGAVGGFREDVLVGEDADLFCRIRAELGLRLVGDPAMLTYHAVLGGSLRAAVRDARRWGDLPALIARHPTLRAQLPGRIFFVRSHAWLGPMLAGLALAGRDRRAVVLALPYVFAAPRRHGDGLRGRLRDAALLPGQTLIDVAGVAALARGSLRHRTVLL